MRVLLLNQFYMPDTAATGQLLADVAEALVDEGHEVSVICSRRLYAGGTKMLPSSEELKGVSIYRVGGSGFGRSHLLGRLIDYGLFYVLAFWRAFRLPRMDVCLCLTTPPFIGLVGVLLSKWRGTRMGLWVMDVYPEIAVTYGVLKEASVFYRVLARVSRWVYVSSDYVISIGGFMTKHLVDAGCSEGKITTIDHWVPGESISVLPEQGSETSVTCVYAGNLGMGQDLSWLVRTAAQFSSTLRPHLLFVGHGAMKGSLQALVGELDLRGVEFRSPVPLDQLGDLLAEGDIHVVMQQEGTEGLLVPSKIYSVLASGRPVLFIGPAQCEVAELLRRSGAGVVVSFGDDEALTDALESLCMDRARRLAMGRQARRYYEAQLGRKRHADKVLRAMFSEAS